MKTKQTIAVIGAAGTMGRAISRSLATGNYRLLLCSDEPENVAGLVAEITGAHPAADVEAIDCVSNASWEADMILLAVPFSAEAQVAARIKDMANQKIVISIANPINATYDGLLTAPDTSAAEELQKALPNSKVVKAFNTTFAADFSTPVIDGTRVDAFIAGDHEDSVHLVGELVKTAGFNPVVAGGLAVSGTLERMQLLLIQLTVKNGYNWLAGWKILHQ